MPGKNLNHDEKKLETFWANPQFDAPFLKSMEIAGGTGLRGIDRLIIPFRYPITVICGKNGAGKTTILSLSALAHHSPAGWYVHWGNTGLHRTKGDRTYYTFSDFFIQSPTDTAFSNVTITWRYWQVNREVTCSFTKIRKWNRKYSSRPLRGVDFLPLSRSLPAYEIKGVRSTFLAPGTRPNIELLSPRFRKLLSYIMGKNYAEAEIQKSRQYFLQRCTTDVSYTAFNMGGGETCMITLLHALERIPKGGLLVVEEIETGLHPEAQKKLARVLTMICLYKQIQIICSSHSEVFISALPQVALLLIQKNNDTHTVYEAPTVSFIMSEMKGIVQPELVIYCEDESAKILIEEALPYVIRKRVTILEVGSDVNVIRQGVVHTRIPGVVKCLSILDGDCTAAKVSGCLRSETGDAAFQLESLILPGGGLPPEKWVVEQLANPAYENEFVKQMRCSVAEAKGHIETLAVELDHHNLGYCLHSRTGYDKVDCTRRVMKAVVAVHPQLDVLRTKVTQLLG